MKRAGRGQETCFGQRRHGCSAMEWLLTGISLVERGRRLVRMEYSFRVALRRSCLEWREWSVMRVIGRGNEGRCRLRIWCLRLARFDAVEG